MEIRGDTGVLGIFGHPVSHSLSPLMQNAALEACGLNMVYLAFDVDREELCNAVRAIRALKLIGVNVTIPHKEGVIKYLDEVVGDALICGSVNTILNDKGRLRGFSTDGEGYVRSLAEEGVDLEGKRVLVLGAGGAAKGIVLAILKRRPRSITISNRTPERAEDLLKRFEGMERVKMEAIPFDHEALAGVMKRTDLLINTTPLGMEGREPLRLPLHHLPEGAVVSDIVYKPVKTPLLKEAEGLGYKTIDGVGMLVEQGAMSFEIWTGIRPPKGLMRDVVIKALSELDT